MKKWPQGKSPAALVCATAVLCLGVLAARFHFFRPPPTPSPLPSQAGTRRMVERLEKIARESDPVENVFLNHQRAELFRSKLSGNRSPRDKVDGQIQMSLEYFFAGETETAIQELS